jgi:hypothetical protein
MWSAHVRFGVRSRLANRQYRRHSRFPATCLHNCVPISDLDRLLVTDLGARSSPAAAKRCAKGAGLEGAPKSVTSSKRSQIFSSFVWSFFRSKASPLRACSTRRTNLYPAGYNPFQGPSCALRGLGLQGGWDHSLPRRRSAMSRSGHTSTLDFVSSCYPGT